MVEPVFSEDGEIKAVSIPSPSEKYGPLQALRERDDLSKILLFNPKKLAERSNYSHSPIHDIEKAIPLLSLTLSGAEVILWDTQIWNHAINGQEVFLGAPLQSGLLDFKIPQWWVYPGALVFGPKMRGIEYENAFQETYGLPAGEYGIHSKLVCSSTGFGGRIGEIIGDGLFVVLFLTHYETKILTLRYLKPLMVGQETGTLWSTEVAGLSFMKQEIAGVSLYQTPRGDRRRAKKAGLPEPVLKQIYLRKRARSESHDPYSLDSDREYSCQWYVRPHWRKNIRKPEKPIYVNGYVKGPDDKPFKAAAPTVVRVSR